MKRPSTNPTMQERAVPGKSCVRRQRERGFSLVLISLGLTVMLGMLGLAFDLGRMFIVKNELQTFVDASAMAACRQMDGTQTGVQTAHNTATAGPLGSTKPNGWNFDVNAISNVTDTYSTSFTGTYDSYATASSSATNSYRYMNVTASASLPLYFMAVIPGLPTAQSLQAQATAGQQEQSATFSTGGLVPVSPAAHNAADTKNFGFTPNTEYTLKWGAPNNTTTCAGDSGFTPDANASSHGFVHVGQPNGTSSLDSVIVYGGYPNSTSTPNHISVGDQLTGETGDKGSGIFTSFATRSNQDPDQTSLTWEQYKASGTGNGRRIVTAPIYDPHSALTGGNGSNATIGIIGFGNFLLDPGATIAGSSGPLCGTYIGPGSQNGWSSGGGNGTKVYNVMLFQ